jgi:hypothetical protein
MVQQGIHPSTTKRFQSASKNLPGGTAGYPAHPRLIRPSVCYNTFNFSAENLLIPTIKAGIDTVGYPAQPRLTLAEKIKGPTNLILIFRNKHDKSGKIHTTNRFGQ